MDTISLKDLLEMSDEDIHKLKTKMGTQGLSETSKTTSSVTEKTTNNVNETQNINPIKPKRKCTEKQLAALAAGRAKNPKMKAKQERESSK